MVVEKVTMQDVEKAFLSGHVHHKHMDFIFSRLNMANRTIEAIKRKSAAKIEDDKHKPQCRYILEINNLANDYMVRK